MDCAQALDALGRGGVRPRIRSRHLHDRRRVRLQHGRDGEQGPQRLQRQIRAGLARDRDRRRLRRHRGGHRARIFPQLDRQPHHLPRLVPALPEGRPDGLPRPGIHRRPALARRSSASATCARCARISSSRTPGPLAHPVRPELYHEINNFYTATVYEKGAEVVRMLKTLLGAETFRKGMDLYFERHDGEAATVEEFVQCFADVSGRDLDAVHALVLAGRHAARSSATRHYDAARARPTGSTSRRRSRRRPASRPRSRWSFRSRSAWSAATAATCRSRSPTADRSSAACSMLTQAGAELRLHRRRRAAGALAQPRLLGADQADAPIVSADDLRFLAAHDSDPFNRWQAVQTLAMRAAGRQRRGAARRRSRRAMDDGLIDALGGDPRRRRRSSPPSWRRR